MIFKFKNVTYSTDPSTYKTLKGMIIRAGVNRAKDVVNFALNNGWIQKLLTVIGLDILSTVSFVSGGRIRTAYRYLIKGRVIPSTLII